jgi:cytochrome c biogenesis protein CcmG/thiol:disulfide interchange protein DsbE
MRARIIFMLPLVVFAGLTVWFAIGLTRDPSILPSALIDKPVPEFALPALLDDVPGFATGDFGGEVVLVNVFASWCVACRIEHPILMRLAEEKTVPIFGLNWKDEKDDATAWLAELGNPYARIGHDLSGRVGIDWGVYGVPETYIIDAQGRIRYKHVGPMYPATVTEVIRPLINKLREERPPE